MRRLLLLILLSLVVAPAVSAQEAGVATEKEAVREAKAAAPALPTAAELRNEAYWKDAVRPQETGQAAAHGERRQNGQNFLYQILLTAVSALVTALIWKAVWD